ncbi:MAG: SDR family NAD(P)-dependent oxidoreductase [Desulfarculales bacterium]|jgi:UDP-glucose 4-epimerase|nr:SDR family NAD(P)-dependent oxidoreductase [Desulfarculales bacterium]
MSLIITGGAGFIGSKLARCFLEQGHHVLALDNLCRGQREYIETLPYQERLTFVQADASDAAALLEVCAQYHARHPVSALWHLAANSDIPAGIAEAAVDLRDTFMTTYAVLEAMKKLGIKKLAFASSSAVYGDHGPDVILREDMGPLLPISNYGAMKLASEALISAAAESFLAKAWIFRFPNVVGVPATHGVILDFIRKLKENPDRLEVLGNGTQQKAYLHVDELVEAMLFIAGRDNGKCSLYNIGPDDSGCRVADIASAVVKRVSPEAQILLGREGRGWVGDVPKFRYCVDKAASLGWKPRLSSLMAVSRAVEEIAKQEEIPSC